MTGETIAVSQRKRFERALLQPESVAVVLWRRRNEFLVRIALRLTSLMTGAATVGFAKLMLVVRKKHVEVRHEVSPFGRNQKWLAQTRKRKTRSVARAGFDVAIGTDARRGSFTRKELRTMTTDARLVTGKLGNVGKGLVLANSLPVRRGKLVTGPAFEFVFVGQMREPRIIDPGLRSSGPDWSQRHEETQEA